MIAVEAKSSPLANDDNIIVWILTIIIALNALFNRSMVYKSQIDMAIGSRPFRRGGEPAVGLIWLIFQLILGIFVIGLNAGTLIANLTIISLVLIMLFIVFSFIWRIEDSNRSESGYLTMEDICLLIHESLETDGDIYYKAQESAESDGVTFVVWTEKSEDVYWFRFSIAEEGYVYEASMKSDSLVKADVVGKEDGIM